jgi:glycosyltransferase involved in cell wall biosynthesis
MPAKRVKVLRLITSLRVSGPALQAILLNAKFPHDTHETRLVVGATPLDSDNMLAVAQTYGIQPLVIPDLRRSLNPLTNFRALRQLYRLMREYQPDVVHTHLTTAGFWGRIVARLCGVPVVVHTLHEHPFKGYYKAFQTRLFVTLERLTAPYTDSLITLSERLRRELSDEYHVIRRSAITVLPLGFDLAHFAETPRHNGVFRRAHGLPLDVPLVGIIGRLIPVKNHALFLQAVKIVHAQLPHVRFVIVGDGALRPELAQKVQEWGLQNVVQFVGWQTDMPAVYSDLDVLVISSLNEGTPVPIIEALSAGCAVVATEVGGVADLLDNGTLGKLVPSDNAHALAHAMIDVLQNPPDSTPAKEAMLSRYSIERLVRDMDSLYRGLLMRKKSHH